MVLLVNLLIFFVVYLLVEEVNVLGILLVVVVGIMMSYVELIGCVFGSMCV